MARADRGSSRLPEADDADRLEQNEGTDAADRPRRGSGDPWSPEADVAEQAAPVAADIDEAGSDADRVEPIDDAGYD